MLAIYKREMKAYFISPIGYVFIAMFLVMSGLIFALCTLYMGENSDVTAYYSFMIFTFVIIIPLLTMKLFSDEKRLKTETLLLTAPVSLYGMVLAKFFAALTMYAVTLAISCINLIPLYAYNSAQNTQIVLGNLVAVFLIGSAFISIGLFISSLTENQIIAAISTIAVIVVLLIIGLFSNNIGFAPLRILLEFLAVFNRFTYFTYGYLDYSALLYYASISLVFLFLTVRVFEKRRWS